MAACESESDLLARVDPLLLDWEPWVSEAGMALVDEWYKETPSHLVTPQSCSPKPSQSCQETGRRSFQFFIIIRLSFFIIINITWASGLSSSAGVWKALGVRGHPLTRLRHGVSRVRLLEGRLLPYRLLVTRRWIVLLCKSNWPHVPWLISAEGGLPILTKTTIVSCKHAETNMTESNSPAHSFLWHRFLSKGLRQGCLLFLVAWHYGEFQKSLQASPRKVMGPVITPVATSMPVA